MTRATIKFLIIAFIVWALGKALVLAYVKAGNAPPPATSQQPVDWSQYKVISIPDNK